MTQVSLCGTYIKIRTYCGKITFNLVHERREAALLQASGGHVFHGKGRSNSGAKGPEVGSSCYIGASERSQHVESQ